ncbi:uncharacterized protein LOC105393058 [Plutella xylostella]|uniref:uncharacterized protein LOC105393058 n=1 Tax=Plutella xylostella TaxID=51655 RepID=UPI00203255B4|nr:uncharacterized protein LOC105393058 [Plutella xylostella]
MYAIAGYKYYLTSEEIYTNPCAMLTKRKVVMTCIPKPYSFAYNDMKKWVNLDIAVAKVERPYNFHDVNLYLSHQCSYAPGMIEVNYDEKYQRPGTDAFVLGWGHKRYYRQQKDSTDYNSKVLHSSSVAIRDVSVCTSSWPEEVHHVIRKYMICSNGSGSLDSSGNRIDEQRDGSVKRDGCSPDKCGVNYSNDHGGPLVGWAGTHEVLLGVQSAFLLNKEMECVGPYLYTSAVCNSAFLDCVLTNGKRLNMNCRSKNPEELGFRMVNRRISWEEHPDGPAANELLKMRPEFERTEEVIKLRSQVPIY